MKRRILAALAILMGEPIPHEYADCPNISSTPIQWVWEGQPDTITVNDWETVADVYRDQL